MADDESLNRITLNPSVLAGKPVILEEYVHCPIGTMNEPPTS